MSLRRAGQVPAAVAYALALLQVLALPLAGIGGMMVPATYWLAVGRMLAAGSLRRALAEAA